MFELKSFSEQLLVPNQNFKSTQHAYTVFQLIWKQFIRHNYFSQFICLSNFLYTSIIHFFPKNSFEPYEFELEEFEEGTLSQIPGCIYISRIAALSFLHI